MRILSGKVPGPPDSRLPQALSSRSGDAQCSVGEDQMVRLGLLRSREYIGQGRIECGSGET